MDSGPPRVCITIRPAPESATTSAICGSKVRPLISLTNSTPAATAAAATALLLVSIEIGSVSSRCKASITGRTRSNSSATETEDAPGLVLSPPTSISAAPSRAIHRPCSRAASTVEKRPPSEKESGVTFRMPTIHGTFRSNRTVRPARYSGCGPECTSSPLIIPPQQTVLQGRRHHQRCR